MSHSMSNWVGYGSGVLRYSIISNISYISIIVISMVVDMLSTTIRKVDRVGTLYNTSTIIGLCLVECSTRVVMSNNRGMVNKRSMVDNRGMGNGNWMCYSMSNWSTNNSMSKSMNYWMSNNTSSSMETVWRVSYSSNTSSESLGLDSTSMFSLEWFGY